MYLMYTEISSCTACPGSAPSFLPGGPLYTMSVAVKGSAMEAKKGFLAIFLIICACSCIAVGATIIGWKALGRVITTESDAFLDSILTNNIDIEKEDLENYLSENGIICKRDASTSMGDYEAYVCDTSDIRADVNFQITYSSKENKPFSISIGIAGIENMEDIADDDDLRMLLEAAAGIPYPGSDAVEARDWLNGCLDIGDYDELIIAKTIAEVTFRIYHTKGNGFTFSISRNMAYEFDF
jgi:hypothetical protein